MKLYEAGLRRLVRGSDWLMRILENLESATAVSVRLLADDGPYVAAPLGLRDLFELILRRNPRRVTPESFCERVDKKGVRERWPKVRVIEGDVHPVTS